MIRWLLSMGDSVPGKLAILLVVIAMGLAVAGQLVMSEMEALFLAVVAVAAGLALLVLDSLIAPTAGKLAWVLGLGLLVAPFVVPSVPVEAIVAGIAVLVAARYKRIAEVVG